MAWVLLINLQMLIRLFFIALCCPAMAAIGHAEDLSSAGCARLLLDGGADKLIGVLEFRDSIRAQLKAGVPPAQLSVEVRFVKETLQRAQTFLKKEVEDPFYKETQAEQALLSSLINSIEKSLLESKINYFHLHSLTYYFSVAAALRELPPDLRTYFLTGGDHPRYRGFGSKLDGPIQEFPNIHWIQAPRPISLYEVLSDNLPYMVAYPTFQTFPPAVHNRWIALGIRPIGLTETVRGGLDRHSFTSHDFSHYAGDLENRTSIGRQDGSGRNSIKDLPLNLPTPQESEDFYWEFFKNLRKEPNVMLRQMVNLVWFSVFHETSIPVSRNNLIVLLEKKYVKGGEVPTYTKALSHEIVSLIRL